MNRIIYLPLYIIRTCICTVRYAEERFSNVPDYLKKKCKTQWFNVMDGKQISNVLLCSDMLTVYKLPVHRPKMCTFMGTKFNGHRFTVSQEPQCAKFSRVFTCPPIVEIHKTQCILPGLVYSNYMSHCGHD